MKKLKLKTKNIKGEFMKKRSIYIFLGIVLAVLILFISKNTIKTIKVNKDNSVIYMGIYDKDIIKSLILKN